MGHQRTTHTLVLTGAIFLFLASVISYLWPGLWNSACTIAGCFVLILVAWRITRILNGLGFIPPPRVSPHQKAVFITGTDHGFGHHLAIRLYQDGYTVFAGCLSPNGEGAVTLQKSYSNDRMKVIPLDVSQDQSVQDAVAQVKTTLDNEGKKLWAVVNNAGIAQRCAPLFEFKDIEEFVREVEVNQLGVVRVTKAFLPFLRQSKGRLVIVSSTSGRAPYPTGVGYSMTKSALIAMANGLRLELRRFGIKVITIEPRFYKTPLIDVTFDELKSSYETSWKAASDQLRTDYGESYFQATIKGIYHIFVTKGNTNIGEVVSAMENAVTYEEPDNVDLVCKPHEEFTLGIFFLLPTKLQEFFSILAGFCPLPIGPLEYIKTEITSC